MQSITCNTWEENEAASITTPFEQQMGKQLAEELDDMWWEAGQRLAMSGADVDDSQLWSTQHREGYAFGCMLAMQMEVDEAQSEYTDWRQ